MPPYISVRDSDNLSGFGGITNADGADDVNPVRVQEWGYSRNNEVKVFGTLSAEMRIIDGLNLKTTIGGDLAENRSESFTPSYDTGFQQQDYASIAENRFTAFSRTWSTTLNFDRAFGSHNLSSTLGYEYQKDIFQSLSGDGKNNSTDLITTPAGIQEILSLSGSKSEDVLLSYFGRVNYNYDDRYLLEASLRRDGYSRFGPQNKWSLFPAASVGWNIARESFMTGLPVSQLKLRGSWGLTGNNNAIGAYEWQAGVTASSAGSPLVYAFGQDNSTIVNPTTILEIANPFLKWETTEQINVGVDLGLLENSFTLSANYFQNTTEDILLNIPLAPTLGFQGGTRANTGTVETSGFEFTAGYESQNPGEFNWSIQGNFSTNNNEVTDIGRGNPINLGDWAGSDLNPNRVEEGEPLFYFYGWKVDRLFTENDFRADGTLKDNIPTHQNDCADPTSCTSPGDIKFVDVNGDGQITPEDRTNLGSPHPDYYYGATATVDAYDFDLSATVQGTGGVNILQNYKYWTQGMTRVFNAESNVLDAWTPQNSDTSVPRAINGDPNRNARFSDRFVDDGDYLRLKRVTLGYTLPVERLGVSSTLSRARLYVQGANLLTFTGYEGYDPEVFQDPGAGATEDVGFGYDSGTYVQPRSFTVGVQMNF
jgi:TonB-linked SusC/RagA family outer membrane protein